MAAVSAWAKPGAWALDSEEHEAQHKEKGYSDSATAPAAAISDFPSLSAAKTTTKKKKKQTFSLAEFSSGAAERKFQPSSRSEEPIVLPTGPRERSAEELERPRGFGYSSYGREPRGASDEGRRREPREPRDSGPSRADEADDWGSTKRSVVPERRERGGGGGGFFDSQQSRADESDSWVSKKPAGPSSPAPPRGNRFEIFGREGSGGGRVDSDSWGRKREETTGGRLDSDSWGKKREEATGGAGGRPRLVLQPRSLPVANRSDGEAAAVAAGKSKGANPFGEARPREEVLKEKGKDWKEIDEKLEAVKIQEPLAAERKGFGMGNGGPREDRMGRAWRKPDSAAAATTTPERAEDAEQLPEN
ncbi:eukaryotic translation initiation factor 4B3-like [Iris pallida]|uniref:Eukaryotic translation initiation factor 4B3-like n=1 Tax=Iris pallida TaxID=29817 RepID=A0AAX6IJ09_IRIPA|nr:eukaryotic translation initiation factor 4B3-like [Iris pallida]